MQTFKVMSIHLPASLMFTRGTRFWLIPICGKRNERLISKQFSISDWASGFRSMRTTLQAEVTIQDGSCVGHWGTWPKWYDFRRWLDIKAAKTWLKACTFRAELQSNCKVHRCWFNAMVTSNSSTPKGKDKRNPTGSSQRYCSNTRRMKLTSDHDNLENDEIGRVDPLVNVHIPMEESPLLVGLWYL